MLSNYLRVALRRLVRDRLYAFISVSSLAVGLACSLLLLVYVQEEWSFDRHHVDAASIYRVNAVEQQPSGAVARTAQTPAPLGPALSDAFPDVRAAVRIASREDVRAVRDDVSFTTHVLFADATLPDVFSFEVVAGDLGATLARPDAVALTASTAQRVFGDADPLGNTLTLVLRGDEHAFDVGAVVADPPPTSSLRGDVLAPFDAFRYTLPPVVQSIALENWQSSLARTFVRLAPEASSERLRRKLPAFVDRRFGDAARRTSLELQPLTDIHFDPGVSDALTPAVDALYLRIIVGIALLILLVACINFATLSLGRSADRTQEVGVRKALGAENRHIRHQFWGEALILSALGAVGGVALAAALIPVLNQLTGRAFGVATLLEPSSLGLLLGLTVVTGALAGAYPSVVLARLQPSAVFRAPSRQTTGATFTRVVTVLQYAVSTVFVVGALVVSSQLHYLKGTDYGIDVERILVVDAGDSKIGATLFPALKQEVEGHSAIARVSGSFFAFGYGRLGIDLQADGERRVRAAMNGVEAAFTDAMGIDVVDGRTFRRDDERDAVIVNEALVRSLGWTSAVGKTLPLPPDTRMRQLRTARIVGVVEDFHYRSLHHAIEPLVMVPHEALGGGIVSILVRTAPDADGRALARVEQAWSDVASGVPFQYAFLEDRIAEAYATEERQQNLVRYASILALLIAALGLFGHATLTAERRRKEMGIRKVLGASEMGIIGLLSRDALGLVLVAFVVAVPPAYVAARQWLQGFAYRVDVGVPLFLQAAALVVLVALASVVYQAYRAATADPVRTLRTD